MAKFQVQGNLFTRLHPTDDGEDGGEGLPSPHLLKVNARRMAGIREAHDALAHFPTPGESLHVVCTTRLDLTDVLGAVLERCGPCLSMRVATLSYNERNERHLLAWLDAGAVKSLALLCSIFFRSHKGALWAHTQAALRERGHRAACAHSHAKVVTMEFTGGVKLAIEGSANLCSSGSGREQFALVADAGLHDWHRAWIEEVVTRAEGKERSEDG